MGRLGTAILLAVLAAPLAARADGSIQLAGRAGVAKPFGDVANGQKLPDAIDWAFPLEAQLAFRVLKPLAVGAYGRYAPTTLASKCSGCTVNDLGVGLVAEYRFSEKLEGGPYLGLSAGYEQLKLDRTVASAKESFTYSGFEGAVTAGVDFELGGLTLGPYLELSLGQFGKASATGGGSASLESKGMHGFFGGGLRVMLLL